MYFEIYKKGKLVKRGNDVLNTINFSNELMDIPQVQLDLPIHYLEYIAGREHFKLYVNNKCFWGIIKDVEVDKANEKINISLSHHIDEWNNRQVSINNAIDDKKINTVFEPDSGGIYARDVKNRVYMVGSKLSLTYSDFRGKSKEYIDKYIKAHTNVKAYDMDTKERLSPIILIKTNIKLEKLKSAKKITTVRPGTYTAVFGYKINDKKTLKIKIPVSISYRKAKTSKGSDEEVIWNIHSFSDELEKIINDANFTYFDWITNFVGKDETEREEVENTRISYMYSRQSKLEALTKTMELTDDLFWRVGFDDEKVVDIGRFGEVKPYSITTHTYNNHNPYIKEHNIQIIEEPVIRYDFDRVVNVATVISEKSESGASSTTLRDLYNMQHNEDMQKEYPSIWKELKPLLEEFPIVIIRDANYTSVNNDRLYGNSNGGYTVDIFAKQSPIVAPNTSLEYAIIDKVSVAMESGEIIEGSYDFNDISPITDNAIYNEDGSVKWYYTKKLTNKQRIFAELVVYKKVIKKLKEARRNYSADIVVSELPKDINVGDKVRFVYTNKIWNLGACSNYWKKLIQKDDIYYITKIEYNIDVGGAETDTITISKQLKIERETEDNGY